MRGGVPNAPTMSPKDTRDSPQYCASNQSACCRWEAREWARETSCGRHPRRAGQAQPGRIHPLCHLPWPVRLVPVAPHAPSQYSALVPFSQLSPSVGVGHRQHSPPAVGLGASAGLLVGVPDLRPYHHCRPCGMQWGGSCLARLLAGTSGSILSNDASLASNPKLNTIPFAITI
jgi:hypothetical protein